MFKKLISTLFGKKENESHAPIDPTQLHRMLRIGVLNEDVIDPNSDEIEKALKQLEALRYEDNTHAILEVPNSEFNFIQTSNAYCCFVYIRMKLCQNILF